MNLKIYNFFNFLFCFAFFFPIFHNFIGPGLGAIALNGAIITFIFLFVGLLYNERIKFQNGSKNVYLSIAAVFCIMMIHIPLSMLIGVFFGNIDLIVRDFYELHRPLLYLLLFTIGFFAFKEEKSLYRLHKLLIGVFITLIILGLNHFLGIIDLISLLYTEPLNVSSRRVSTPFVNPYDYAFIMSFFIIYFYIYGVYKNKWYLCLSFLSLIMFLLPQSRSVAVGMIVCLAFIMPLVFIKFNLKKSFSLPKPLLRYFTIFILFVACFIASIPFLIDKFGYLTEQFIRFIASGSIGNSAGLRVEQFLFALDKAQNPMIFIFGNGPAKSELQFVESIYNYQFYRYGLAGLLIYFLYPLLVGLVYSYQTLRNLKRSSKLFPLYLAFFIWFATIPFMSIGNNFTEQIRISFFYYAMLGMIAKSYYLFVVRKDKVT